MTADKNEVVRQHITGNVNTGWKVLLKKWLLS